MVGSAGATFNAIVDKVLEVSEQIRQTALTVDQVAHGSQKIVSSVGDIDMQRGKPPGRQKIYLQPLRSNPPEWKKSHLQAGPLRNWRRR